MLTRFSRFVRAVSISPLGRLGAVLVTSSFITFVLMEMARVGGVITNSYVGLITYLLLPLMFVVGLALLPIAWRNVRKKTGLSTRELLESQFGTEDTRAGFFGSSVYGSILIFTLLNVVFLITASGRGLHFMESAEFCGTACHSVMNPEWTTYQHSAHSRVDCVECHVGEGTAALIDSKLNGAYQMLSVTFDLLERPIPVPVHNLRPARETCEKCHWPEKFYGDRLKTLVSFDSDSTSTPRYTTLNLKVDASGDHGAGIHWHVAPENEVRYVSVDRQRMKMAWVEARQPDGSWKRWERPEHAGAAEGAVHEEARSLDCVDCHNRATHVYEDPEKALDDRMRHGQIDRSLPFVKREGLKVLLRDYADAGEAATGIEAGIAGFYRQKFPRISSTKGPAIDEAVATLLAIWERNIHPGMNIGWGTYPSHLGHEESPGCFRCHTRELVDTEGAWIDESCTLCHSILAEDSLEPFRFLQAMAARSTGRLHRRPYRRNNFDVLVKSQN